MDTEPLKHAFWAVIVDCLVEFHGLSPVTARSEVAFLRQRIEDPPYQELPPAGYDPELFYHSEPFYVACNLARRELDLDEHRDAYERLVATRYEPAERAALAAAVARQPARRGLAL